MARRGSGEKVYLVNCHRNSRAFVGFAVMLAEWLRELEERSGHSLARKRAPKLNRPAIWYIQ
jgi:hypothetical protein